MGLLDPMTSDGRMIFFLSWTGSTIVWATGATVSRLEVDPQRARYNQVDDVPRDGGGDGR
jgi:glycerol-3-phosphate dehydrogenase